MPESLPGLDISSALDRLKGNKLVLNRLLRKFAENYKDSSRDLKQALEQGDTKTAQEIAHSIKGVAGNLSAEKLYGAALRLERAIRQEDRHDYQTSLDAFDKALAEVLQSIRTIDRMEAESAVRKTEITKKNHAPDLEALTPLLKDLAELLELGQAEAVGSLSSIEPFLRVSPVSREWRSLEEAVQLYDFDKGLRTLKHIAHQLGISLK